MAGRASIGSNSGIGHNFHGSGRNLGRGDRGTNRDRAHQKRREGRNQMALKLRTGHRSISLFTDVWRNAVDPYPFLFKLRANSTFPPKIPANPFMVGKVSGISHQQLGGYANHPAGTGKQPVRCARKGETNDVG
jgi:hypothetical protein